MKLRHELKKWTLPAVLFVSAIGAAIAGPPPQHATPTSVFATDTGTDSGAAKAIPGVAATVDGHPIPMKDVVLLALRNDRSYVVDQLIQRYVVRRECEKRGIQISDAEIDAKIAELRKNLAPQTLEDAIKQHNSSMADVREDFWQSIARVKLVIDQIKPAPMVHCRTIVVKYCPDGAPAATFGTSRTEQQAQDLLKSIQDQLKKGADFGDLAAKYSETDEKAKKGDIGVIFEGIHDVDTNIVSAALKLGKGETSDAPVKLESPAYGLIQVVSTDALHDASEDTLYKAADEDHREIEAQFVGPQYVVGLVNSSKIVYVSDADLMKDKDWPTAAATVDGHPILMKDVIDQCMKSDGQRCADMLVEDYVVDRECARRHITASAAEIDKRIDELKKEIAPHTMEEALAAHHTTLDQLRRDFQQQIKREKLVEDQVKPTKMVHCRVIWVKDPDADASTQPVDYTKSTPGMVTIRKIQDELKGGTDFASLAKQYPPDAPSNKDGDVGVLFAGMHNCDTALLNAGLALKAGEVTKDPVKVNDGWCLIQAVSTSDSHATSESAAYADALDTYKSQEAEMIIPPAIMKLIKQSKIVYFVNS